MAFLPDDPDTGYVFSSRAFSPAAPSETAQLPQSDENKYSDYTDALVAGYHGLGASASELISRGAQNPDFQRYWAGQAQDQRQQRQDAISDISPAGQTALQLGPLDREFWRHPLRSIKMQAAQQAPELAAALAPGLVFGPAGLAAGFGLTGAGDALSDFKDIVHNASHDDLMRNKEYAEFSKVMSEDDAKAAFADKRIQDTGLGWKAGILGAVVGAVLPEGSLGAKSTLSAVGKGAAVGAAAGAVQDLGTNLAISQASGKFDQTDDLVKSAAGSAVTMGVLGGLGGLKAHLDARKSGKQVGNRGRLESEALPGEQSSTGSPTGLTVDLKPTDKPEKNVPEQSAGTGIAPAPDPKSPDIDAALAAATEKKDTVTPGVTKPPETPSEIPKIQPEVAQPSDMVRSPSVPDMSASRTGEKPPLVSEPQPTAEPGPAPSPATAIASSPEALPPTKPSKPPQVQDVQKQSVESDKDKVLKLISSHKIPNTSSEMEPLVNEAMRTGSTIEYIGIDEYRKTYKVSASPDGSKSITFVNPRDKLTTPGVAHEEQTGIAGETADKAASDARVEEEREETKKTEGDGLTQLKDRIAAERGRIDLDASPAMIKAGNYEKGHVKFEGEDITLETGKGQVRQPWATEMPADYGYIRGTVGKDGDHIDTFIHPDSEETGKIYVMNQNTTGGVFDEHKVFMGFSSKDEAAQTYIHSFDDPKRAARNIAGIVELNKDEFKEWLDKGDKFQPISSGLEGEHPDKIVETINQKGWAVRAPYLERATFKDASRYIDLKNYSESMQANIKKLMGQLNKLVGDVPIYGMSSDAMQQLGPDRGGLLGFYNGAFNHIIIDVEGQSEKELGETVLHETFHAATSHALRTNKVLADLAQRLFDEVNKLSGAPTARRTEGLSYGFTNPEELLTEIHSNPEWSKWLKNQPISPELARDLDMPRWRRATLYQGFLDWFRKMLGLGPRDYGIVEAAFNIGERLMWAKEPADEYGYRLRASQVSSRDMNDFGPIRAKMRAKDIEDLPNRIESGFKEALKSGSSNIASLIREQGKRVQPMMDMIYGNDKFFGPQTEDNILRQTGNTMMSMEGERVAIRKQSDGLLHRVMTAMRSIPDEISDLHELLQRSDFSNVHPDEPLGVGRNKHIQVNKTNVENSSQESWEAIRDYPKLSKMYNNLSPIGKGLFNGIRNMLEHINKTNLEIRRNNIISAGREEVNNNLERGDAAEYKAAFEKIVNGDRLDKDSGEEEKYGNEPVIKAIREADAMLKRQGFYFPSKRFGKYVVTGEHDYDVPGTGVRDEKDPHKITFTNRKDAFSFVHSLDLPSRTTHTSDISVDKGPIDKYTVHVGAKHVEFMDSAYEGKKIADALRAAGVKNVTDPVQREQNQYLDYSLHSRQVDAFNKALDRMQYLTPGVRETAKEAIHHMAIASMQGNRLNKSFLQKYRVAGADTDLLRTLDSYRSSAATFQAGAKYQPQIDKLLQGVRDIADSARKNNSPHTLDMGAVVQEMEYRLYGKNGKGGFKNGENQITNGILHNVAALGLFKYLFSPAHFALHLMHPVITSIPEMMSEHGLKVYPTMLRVYRDMGAGSTMLSGMKGVWEKTLDFDKKPTDFLDSLKTQLRKAGYDRATINMLETLEHDGYLTHMGLDFSPFYAKAGGLTYLADRSLSIMQELNNSAESINRVGTATAAFILARGKGLSDKEALGYAKRVLSQTHGLYANINRAPVMMNHPVIRSMMQFKTFPMMIYRILARNVYNIYKNDTPGVRWQAIKALTGMIGTAALFTGAQGATPEPIRLGITLTNLMGLTDSWEQQEDRMQRSLAENFSPEVAGIIMHGLGHILGWNLQHRMGDNSLLVFGEPQTTKPQDVENWFTNAALGVPWGLGIDAYTGYQDLLNGDYSKAINLLLPKALADLNKAYSLGTEGKLTSKGKVLIPEVGPMGLLGQALGFVPDQVTEAQQARAAYGADLAQQQTTKEKIDQLKHRNDKTILGYKPTPSKLQELKQRIRDYGIQSN